MLIKIMFVIDIFYMIMKKMGLLKPYYRYEYFEYLLLNYAFSQKLSV